MVSFDRLALEGNSPIYIQIIQYVRRGIVAGQIQDRDEMPSRRMLSALLGVNPNTVQKAFRLREEEGIIESRTGAKSYVSVDAEQVVRIRAQLLAGDARAVIGAMKQMGASKEEALAELERLWDEPPEHGSEE